MAGFDLTFSPSKSISTAWALADADTKATIYACHRRAIEVVLTYAEREVFHSRSGKNGVVQEDVEGVVATAFTHWDSRAGDPQLHDHVVVANRARSVSDGAWRTLDSRGLFKSVVMLGELHQGVLADLLTQELGWDWDERSRRHSDQVRWEVAGVPETLMAEFSQRAAAIEERKEVLIPAFVAAHGRQPTTVEIIKLRQRATLETRPPKEHRAPRHDDRRVVPSGPSTTSDVTRTHGSLGCPSATTCRCSEPATWPTRSSPTRPSCHDPQGLRASGHLLPGQRPG